MSDNIMVLLSTLKSDAFGGVRTRLCCRAQCSGRIRYCRERDAMFSSVISPSALQHKVRSWPTFRHLTANFSSNSGNSIQRHTGCNSTHSVTSVHTSGTSQNHLVTPQHTVCVNFEQFTCSGLTFDLLEMCKCCYIKI
jgi:hypothetical protein